MQAMFFIPIFSHLSLASFLLDYSYISLLMAPLNPIVQMNPNFYKTFSLLTNIYNLFIFVDDKTEA